MTLDNVLAVGEHPAFQAARANYDRLAARLRETEQREQSLEHGIRLAHHGPATARDRVRAGAVALLEGSEGRIDVDVARELGRRREQRRALAEAVQLAQRAIDEARIQASEEACHALAPAYRSRVERLIAAVVEVARANAALEQIEDTLRVKGLEQRVAVLRPMRLAWPGRLEDSTSPVRQFLREAREHGFAVVALPELSTAGNGKLRQP